MRMGSALVVVFMFIAIIIFLRIFLSIQKWYERVKAGGDSRPQSSNLITPAIDRVLDEIEKPIRFTSQELRIATEDFKHFMGAGGYGSVYKGKISNGILVAVKVLKGSSDKKIEDQFLAEMRTIGRTHHINLVRLYGFCFEKELRALVFEYMENSSLDRVLFCENQNLEWEKLYDIAVGTARGIAYLHEECEDKIIHYDIKAANILLDANYCPKVADFGLARLCNRDKSHMTLTAIRGTPGYAAPELWLPFPVTHKCDVYSFGMLLFEIMGRRRNMDKNLPESQEWFPKWVWKKMEKGEFKSLMMVCKIEEKDKDMAERMANVALWCVQHQPEARPMMSIAVKMLEGHLEIPTPKNPFRDMIAASPHPEWIALVMRSSFIPKTNEEEAASPSCPDSTPIMRKYEIELATP